MLTRARLLLPVLLIVLAACTNGNGAADTGVYEPPPGLSSTSAATLIGSKLDTGFLVFGGTTVTIVSVDGHRSENQPVLLAPGHHTVFVKAFRDPIAAYACVSFTFEAGKTYVARTTKPSAEGTTIWLEDKATGEAVSQKVKATNIRDPVMWGPGLKALFVQAPQACP